MLLIHLASLVALSASPAAPGSSYIWRGYGGNPYHDAISTVPSANMGRILWQASLDDMRSYYDGALYIHYASACVTGDNTVVHSFRFTTRVNGSPDYDNWRVIGHEGATGRQLWTMNTDFSAAVVYPTDWTSVYPLSLFGDHSVAAAGAEGTVLVRENADVAQSPVSRIAFYSKYADYSPNSPALKSIKICTPFTSDANGNLWFGYLVGSPLPGQLGLLGTGGVVRISTSGEAVFRSAESLGVGLDLTRPALNSAPALSRDGRSVYFAIRGNSYDTSYLVKLDANSLVPEATVALKDPSLSGDAAFEIDESSASPMVGPDGHVFYGVFGFYYRESHGWMLQFDGNLNPNNSTGTRWPEGAFGWDDTPSVVPRALVPSYTGKASYLILTKYNDYAINTPGSANGVGVNKVAILDPTSNSINIDWQSGIPVMNEVLSVIGPTPDEYERGKGYSTAVCEWCINSAAVDPFSKAAIINSEDGHCYRWSLVTNTLTQSMALAPPTGEAYTSTVIGPDGTCYVINDGVLFAVGR